MTVDPSARPLRFPPLGRWAFLGWGCGLMAVKYNLDRIIAGHFGVTEWQIGRYWRLSDIPPAFAPGEHKAFYLALVYAAVPFILGGVYLTARRLRDAGWPLWLAALFFVPFVNLIFFAALALAPARRDVATPPVLPRSVWTTLSDPRASAAVGILLTALLAIPLVRLSTTGLGTYGVGLFVGLPFFMGLFSALVHSASAPRTFGACCLVAVLSVTFVAGLVLLLAIEGLLCVLMAAPLAIVLAIAGATLAYALQLHRWSSGDTGRLYGVAWILLPAAFLHEARYPDSAAEIAASTTIVVAASPETVWRHVVTFSELPPPRELIFRSGIAYPVRARIWGTGVGAVRHCEFSTGPFVEPITAWDAPHRLAFDVTRQPEPLRELSPYSRMHPPHLDGFFRSQRGEFRLTALPDGRTRLVGTTWYRQDFWPGRYWRVWSDYLIHRIHTRVLEHIRTEAERDARPS